MLLADVALASQVVAATSRRTEKVAAVAQSLRRADPDEVAVVVAYLSGELRQRRTGVGWAALRDLPAPARRADARRSREVDRALDDVGGARRHRVAGRRGARRCATVRAGDRARAGFLRGLLVGELRQGALEGVMVEAVAAAAGVPAAAVRRAAMLRGDRRRRSPQRR